MRWQSRVFAEVVHLLEKADFELGERVSVAECSRCDPLGYGWAVFHQFIEVALIQVGQSGIILTDNCCRSGTLEDDSNFAKY